MAEIKPCEHCGEKMTAALLCDECASRRVPIGAVAEKALELMEGAKIPEPTRHEMYRFAHLEPGPMLYAAALIYHGEAGTLDAAIREAEQLGLEVKGRPR